MISPPQIHSRQSTFIQTSLCTDHLLADLPPSIIAFVRKANRAGELFASEFQYEWEHGDLYSISNR